LLAALATAAVDTSAVTRAVAPALENSGKWTARPVESKRAAGDDWIVFVQRTDEKGLVKVTAGCSKNSKGFRASRPKVACG
jgi:hypothetical protein